jgi:VanZ family protein
MIKSIYLFFKKPYLAILCTLVVFGLCSMPSKHISSDVNDKTAHFLAFAAIGFLWIMCLKNKIYAVTLSVLYGAFIEFWQWLLPESFHRGADIYDFVADSVGVLIGVFIFLIVNYLAKNILKLI